MAKSLDVVKTSLQTPRQHGGPFTEPKETPNERRKLRAVITIQTDRDSETDRNMIRSQSKSDSIVVGNGQIYEMAYDNRKNLITLTEKCETREEGRCKKKIGGKLAEGPRNAPVKGSGPFQVLLAAATGLDSLS